MSQIQFRRPLLYKLIFSFLLCEAGTVLLINFEKQLGPARMPILLLMAGTSFYFLRLLLETAWYDATALRLERTVCRWVTYIWLSAIMIVGMIKLYEFMQ